MAVVEFGRRELELMQIIWRYGEQTAQQIRARVKDDVADPTVRTMLRILEGKGVVTHKKVGRAFIYRATAPAKRTIKKMVKGIIGGFFEGSGEAFVTHLISDRIVTSDAVDKARKKAKRAKK